MPPSNQSGEMKSGGADEARGKVERVAPVVVNLGKAKRKRVKQLKRGEGKLMNDVAKALLKIEHEMHDQLAGKTIVPIVMIVEREADERMGPSWWPMR